MKRKCTESNTLINDRVQEKLNDMVDSTTSDAYRPVKQKSDNELLDLLGEDAYYNGGPEIKKENEMLRNLKNQSGLKRAKGIKTGIVVFLLFIFMISLLCYFYY